MFSHVAKEGSAPEFPSGLTWVNSKSLTVKALRGNVILIDFWTYSCVNCLRTLPHLRQWHKRYASKGLVIIGVHTPEFDFEKVTANVKASIKGHAIAYPVVLDSKHAIWKAYANHWWPREILIDAKGKIIYDHVGEGEYDKTERAIQAALRKIGARRLPKITMDEGAVRGVCYPITPETYLGAKRGRYANASIEQGQVIAYRQPTMSYERPALEGSWKVEQEHVQSYGGWLRMPYMAGEVNVVMSLAPELNVKKAVVGVTIDGKPVARAMAGDDMSLTKKTAVVFVEAARLYRLVLSKTHHEGVLEFEVPAGVRLFAFTFGGACD